MSQKIKVDFNDDYVFYENLSNHLQSIFELTDIPFKENPVLNQILEKNRQIEAAVDKNKDIIEKYIRRSLSSVELTYIAVHILSLIHISWDTEKGRVNPAGTSRYEAVPGR